MNIPLNADLPTRFMGNFFCIIPNTKIAFVVISKNGCTFLKKVARYNETDKWPGHDEMDLVHNTIGYTKESKYLVPVNDMVNFEQKNGEFIKIAVWRDPVERIISTYKLFCLERAYRTYFHFLDINRNISFDRFMDFLRFEWGKTNVIHQDEHIRRQIDYFNENQVNYIVPIEKLYDFLKENGVKFKKEKSNYTQMPFNIESEKYIQEIKQHYEADYKINITY